MFRHKGAEITARIIRVWRGAQRCHCNPVFETVLRVSLPGVGSHRITKNDKWVLKGLQAVNKILLLELSTLLLDGARGLEIR